jgi:WD40 repeat protein
MGNAIVCPSGQNWYKEDFEALSITIERSIFDGTFSLSFRGCSRVQPSLVIKAYKIVGRESSAIVNAYFAVFSNINDQIYGNVISRPYRGQEGAYLIRGYYDNPLPERMLLPPPLEPCEMKWISYQLLRAVDNLRVAMFAHGDIKPENVFVSDSLYVELVDHAPFKPELIKPTQPHYFIHFFSNGRSDCYLAPERIRQKFTHTFDRFAADIFSAACVVAYFYLNGHALFNFTTIQELDDVKPIEMLERIRDDDIRALLRDLLVRDVTRRKNAFLSLDNYFPTWFSKFYPVFCRLQFEPKARGILEARGEIFRLIPKGEADFYLLFFNIGVRALRKCTGSRSLTLVAAILAEAALWITNAFVKLTRILPYFVWLISASNVCVKITAFDAVVVLLRSIDVLPDETRGFLEIYLLPHILRTLRGLWALNFIGRLPRFLCELDRLWPSAFPEIEKYSTLVQRVLNDPMAARSLLTEARSSAMTRDFDFFVKFCQFLRKVISVEKYVPEMIQLVTAFHNRFNHRDQIKFARMFTDSFLDALSKDLDDQPEMVLSDILTFCRWLVQEKLVLSVEFSRMTLFALKGLGASEQSLRVSARQLIRTLPGRYSEFGIAFWCKKAIDVPMAKAPAGRSSSCSLGPAIGSRRRSEIEEPLKCNFLASEKMFDGMVQNVCANVKGNLLLHHSGSALSLVSVDLHKRKDICALTTVTWPRKVSFVNVCRNEGILVTTNQSVTMMTSRLETRGEISLERPFSIIKEFWNDRLITVVEKHNELELRDLKTFQVVSSSECTDCIPVCVANYLDRPISLVAADNGFVYLLDIRVGHFTNLWHVPSARLLVTFDGAMRFAALSKETVRFFDARNAADFLSVNGRCDIALNYQERLLLLNQAGTFMIEPAARIQVKCLFDTTLCVNLPKSKDSSYELPTRYQRSLHSHVFQITAADVDRATGICVSADCAGYVHLWSAKTASQYWLARSLGS